MSTVSISNLSPALERYRNISLNRLEYPDTCVKGVGSTIKQIFRGGCLLSGGTSDEAAADSCSESNRTFGDVSDILLDDVSTVLM